MRAECISGRGCRKMDSEIIGLWPRNSNSSSKVIRLAVLMYMRFSLGLRNIAGLGPVEAYERGVDRRW